MSRLTSLAARLFAATCLAFVAVGLAGLVLVRWSLTADSSPGERAGDVARVERVGAAFVQQLQAHGGDWSFVPADDAAWTALLDDRMARLDQQACGQPCTPAATPLLTRRIALLDEHGRVRAGHVPHPLLVAFASIDSFDHPLVLDGRRVGSLMLMQGDNPTDDLAVAFLIGQQGRLAILAALGALLAAAQVQRQRVVPWQVARGVQAVRPLRHGQPVAQRRAPVQARTRAREHVEDVGG